MTERPLRLLYYVESLGLGGANQTTLTVAREMKRRGHHVLFASDDGPLQTLLDEAGIEHLRIRTRVRHPSRAAARILARRAVADDVDLLLPNGFDCTLDAVLAGLHARRPLFPTYGGMTVLPYPHPRLPRVNLFSEELLADLVQRHGWNRRGTYNLIARIDAERFHPGVSGDALRREWGLEGNGPVLATVCRHDALKLGGVRTLLDAALDLRAAVPGIRILLVGDGSGHDTVRRRVDEIHSHAGDAFVHLPGSSRRTPEVFALADLVVANGARSALEGMACGRAVLSVGPNGYCGAFTPESIAGFRRFNFDKGRLADNPLASTANLVRDVKRLLGEADLLARLERFSIDYAREHLTIQGAASRYEAAYREAIADPPLPALAMRIHWWATVARYYRHRLLRRASAGRNAPDALAPPPPGVDPEWERGRLEAFAP